MADPIEKLNFSVTDPTLSIGPITTVRNWRLDVKKSGSDAGSYVLYDTSFGSGNPPILRNDKVQSGTDANGNPQYTWRTSVVSSYQSTYNNLSEDQKRFLYETMTKNADAQRAKFINVSYTQDQKNNLFPNMSGVRNTAPPSKLVTPGGSTGTAPVAPAPQVSEVVAKDISATVSDGYVRKNYGEPENLKYPESLKLETQDCIQFKMLRYGARSIDASTAEKTLNLKLPDRDFTTTTIKGTVTLPIQPSITDSNGVDWGGANLSPADAYFASLARGAMEGEGGAAAVISGLAGRVSGDLKKALGDSDITNAMLTYFTQEAVGIQGLLSRTAGAVLNPNLELLFNGPTLRPFNFTFRLSPRSEKEAANVRRIIRFFKQGMSVKTSPSSIFLKAPNVFEIKYLTYTKDHHPSLNRIKKCALLGCDVDYTPDGTYMTFNDEAKTMTSYQLSLRFSELEPIYEDDYNKDGLSETDTQIGY